MRSRRKPHQERISAEVELSAEKVKDMAQAIVSARKAAGMTQRQVAEAMQTTQSTIADMERGRSLPSTRTLQKFAEATNHAIQIRFVQRPAEAVSLNERRTMTDTLSRPKFSTNRRGFIGGAIGLAGVLGNMRTVTAQEATAVATAADDYVWTRPQYEEPTFFEIVARNDTTTTVRTIDGEFEVSNNPQRFMCLDYEYLTLVPLGIADGYHGITKWYGGGGTDLRLSGAYTSEIESVLADVPFLDSAWYEVDPEEVIAADADLVMGSVVVPDEGYDAISQITPFVRLPFSNYTYPRAGLRDYGALFGREEQATTLLAEFDDLVNRAKEVIAPYVEGKKSVVLWLRTGSEVYAQPSYWLTADGMTETPKALSVRASGSYFRELELTPSSMIEQLADNDGRTLQSYGLSVEQIGTLDADFIFLKGFIEEMEEFASNPVIQSTAAGKAGQVYPIDTNALGDGLGGHEAEIRAIVSAITGEPFE